MSRDDIIRMAREADIQFSLHSQAAEDNFIKYMGRFAALVAAAEREACAKVCDELAALNRSSPTDSMWQWGECAAAIRARGQE